MRKCSREVTKEVSGLMVRFGFGFEGRVRVWEEESENRRKRRERAMKERVKRRIGDLDLDNGVA